MSKRSAKKKGGKKKGAGAGTHEHHTKGGFVFHDDDAASVAEDDLSWDEDEKVDASDADFTLEDFLDQAQEKRAATRTSAWKSLRKALAMKYNQEFCLQNEETLLMALQNSLRKGARDECVSAAQAMCMIALTLGEEASRLFEENKDMMMGIVKNRAKSSTSRAVVLQAVALMCFLCSDEEKDTNDLMRICTTMYRRGDEKKEAALMLQAIRSWALLATTLSQALLAGSVRNRKVPQMLKLLDCKSLGIRTAAGEVVGLLQGAANVCDEPSYAKFDDRLVTFDADAKMQLLTPHLSAASPASPEFSFPDAEFTLAADESGDDDAQIESDPVDSDDDADADADADDAKDDDVPEDTYDIDDLIDKLHELSTENSRRKARKDRRKQRSAFRFILRTVEEEEVPVESFTIMQDKHELTGWVQVLRLASVRRVLGPGVHVQFMTNPLLQNIFPISVSNDVDADLTKEEIRGMRAQQIHQSKIKTRAQKDHNKKQRKKKLSHATGAHHDD
jgi:Interferon-related developmental regulator (IFRD)